MAIPTGSFCSESAVEEGWKILQFLMQRAASEMRGSPLEKNERQSLEGRYALGIWVAPVLTSWVIPTLKEFVIRLIEECWKEEPLKRPTFSQIIKRLDQISVQLSRSERWKVGPLKCFESFRAIFKRDRLNPSTRSSHYSTR
ncbi:hypothetical protein NL676_001099 [Syzygium grande]|nr:hypothetical protein NL676_001099 [Syzygium grande]